MNGFSLPTVMAISCLISFLICFFYIAVSKASRSERSSATYGFLALAYGCYGVRLAVQFFGNLAVTFVGLASDLLYIGWVCAIWLGVRAYGQSNTFRSALWAVPAMLVIWNLVARGMEISVPWRLIPQHFTGAALFGLAGLHLWRLRRELKNGGLSTLAVLLWLHGLSTASYPFTRDSWYAPYGFTIFALLGPAIGMGLMLTTLIDEQRALLAEMQVRERVEAEVRRLNQELEQRVVERTAQLKAANRELEAFAYSVSHDLRAPLRHIEGYVDLLVSRCRDGLSAQGVHYVDTIAASARRMGTLIDDLLQFSRTGRAELRKEELDMNQALQDVLVPLKETCAKRHIEWVIGKLPSVRGDYALLRQVWANLLENAVKFTRQNEAARIEVSAREDEGEIIFAVADNGVGFDMQYVGKLFGVFQRLHTQEEFEGTGIGLATVQRIVARHGGRIWAEGAVGGGAAFHFSIPASGRGCAMTPASDAVDIIQPGPHRPLTDKMPSE